MYESSAGFGGWFRLKIVYNLWYKVYKICTFLNFNLEGCSPTAPPLGDPLVNTILFLFFPVMLGAMYVVWLL